MKSTIGYVRFLLPLLVAAALAAWGGTAPAATWDVTSGNSQVDDGSGLWDVGSVWTSDSGATNVAWTNDATNPNDAVFGTGMAGTGGAIGTGGATNVGNITFNAPAGAPNYSLSAATLVLGGTGATTPTITTNVDTTIDATSTLTGYAFTKAGSGLLQLNTATSFTSGDLAVTGGTLQVGANQSLPGGISINGGNMLIDNGVTVKKSADNLAINFQSNNSINKATGGTGALTFNADGQTMTVSVAPGTTGTINADIKYGGTGATGNNLIVTGGGKLVLGGNTQLVANDGGSKASYFSVDGGSELEVTGTLATMINNNNGSSNGNRGSDNTHAALGATSGNNTFRLTGTGKMVTGNFGIGAPLYLNQSSTNNGNRVYISSPGSYDAAAYGPTYNGTLPPSLATWTLFGNSAQISLSSSDNYLEISNGAFVEHASAGGTGTWMIGNGIGTNNNQMVVKGDNTTVLRGSSAYVAAGWRGSNNSIVLQDGALWVGGRISAGQGDSSLGANNNNSWLVTGVSSTGVPTYHRLNGATNGHFMIGGSSLSTGNSYQVAAGARSDVFGTNTGKTLGIGTVVGANNNYVSVTGVGSSLNFITGQELTVGGNSSVAGGSGNHVDVLDGGSLIMNNIDNTLAMPATVSWTTWAAMPTTSTAMVLAGANSSLNIGGGTGSTALVKIGAVNGHSGVELKNASSALNINNGRLMMVGLDGNLVSGDVSSTVTLNGPAYFSVSGTTVGATISRPMGGVGSLTKESTGKLILSAANGYSGATTVSGGTLALGASASINNSPTITVGSGAVYDVSAVTGGYQLGSAVAQTLKGNGTVVGGVTGVTVLAGSSVAPGSSTGTLGFADGLDMSASGSGATMVWELGALSTLSGNFDVLEMTGGNLYLGGNSKLSLDFGLLSGAEQPGAGNAFWDSAESWKIVNLTGSSTNFGLSDFSAIVNGSFAGGSFATRSESTGVYLDWTPSGGPSSGKYWAPGVSGGGTGTWAAGSNVWATDPATQGSLAQSSSATLEFGDAAGTVTVNGTVTVTKGMNFTTDGYTIAAGASTPNVNLAGGSAADNTVTVASGIAASIATPITGGGSYGLTKAGDGMLVLDADNSYTGGTTVSGGAVLLATANALPVNQNLAIATGAIVHEDSGLGNAVQVGGLTISGTGKFNLSDGKLVVNGTVTTDTAVRAYIAAGRNGGNWAGSGITSSLATADPVKYAVGYVKNGDLGAGAATTWFGRSVNLDSVLVRLTYAGDADLSGEVTTDDFDKWKYSYAESLPATWYNGDFDYSGVIDTDDFDKWKYAYSFSYPALDAPFAAVPEPGTLGLLVLGVAGVSMSLWLRRRRAAK